MNGTGTVATALLLAAIAIEVRADAPAAPVRVHLEDDGPGVSQSPAAGKLLDSFRERLLGKKRIVLVSADEPADLRLVVREAEVFEDARGQSKVRRKGRKLPTGRPGEAYEYEQEYGVQIETRKEFALVVRLIDADRFVDFDNDPSDRSRDQAARTVADAIDRWIRARATR